MKKDVKLILEHDSDLQCPQDYSDWQLWSFSTKHTNFKHPNEINFNSRKIKNGTSFILSYFEHTNHVWFLKDGPVPPGVEFQFDGVKVAGILSWQGKAKDCGKTKEDRQKHAERFLKEYTAWSNGEGYYYRIEDIETGEELDSCGGYLDSEQFIKEVKCYTDRHDNVVEVTGDAAYLWKE